MLTDCVRTVEDRRMPTFSPCSTHRPTERLLDVYGDPSPALKLALQYARLLTARVYGGCHQGDFQCRTLLLHSLHQFPLATCVHFDPELPRIRLRSLCDGGDGGMPYAGYARHSAGGVSQWDTEGNDTNDRDQGMGEGMRTTVSYTGTRQLVEDGQTWVVSRQMPSLGGSDIVVKVTSAPDSCRDNKQ